ncbi:MAG: PatB family C-S lyase [Porphyromonas sp.]|nr:PatB family C-S lyase [Porphyromonas sp.]
MEKFDFDQIIDRHGTCCTKFDGYEPVKGGKYEDILPLWIADMDFATPSCVSNAIRKRLEHPVLGYTVAPDEYFETLQWWFEQKYGFRPEKEHLMYTPGVVAGIYKLVQLFTEKGDGITIMPPVYTPFSNVINGSDRRQVEAPLRLNGARYEIDWDLLEQALSQSKAMILCNPHNPGGRVWSLEELRRIAELADRYGVFVISDEIHADLTFKEHRHHPFPTVSEMARRNSVSLMAPSKAFNMPGVIASQLYVPDDALREKIEAYMVGNGLAHASWYTYQAVIAAYREGGEWQEACMSYIRDNIDFVRNFLKERIPSITMIEPEASFLIFLNCRGLGFDDSQQLSDFFMKEAGLYLNNGADFGTGGEGFMRLNVGLPKSVLEKALIRLEKAVNELQAK